MARSFFLFAAALVCGLLVGALQPRGELLRAQQELEELRRSTRACNRGVASAGIARIFGGNQPRDKVAADDPGGGEDNAGHDPAPDTPGEVAEAPENPVGVNTTGEPLPQSPEALGEALDARAAQARAALIEQLEPSDEELSAIDAAIDRMNQRLQAQVDALAATMEAGEEPDRRDLMELGAEALDAVIEADDAITAAIPADVREALDPEVLDPFSFIDGETVAGLAALGDGR